MQDYYKFKFPKGRPVKELRMEGWAAYIGSVGVPLVVLVPATTEHTDWQNLETAFLTGTVGLLVLLAHVAEELPKTARVLILICLFAFASTALVAIILGSGLLFWGLLIGYYALAIGLFFRLQRRDETD